MQEKDGEIIHEYCTKHKTRKAMQLENLYNMVYVVGLRTVPNDFVFLDKMIQSMDETTEKDMISAMTHLKEYMSEHLYGRPLQEYDSSGGMMLK